MTQSPRRIVALIHADSGDADSAASVLAAAMSIATRAQSSCEAVVLTGVETIDETIIKATQGASRVWNVVHSGLPRTAAAEQIVAAFDMALTHPLLALESSTYLALASPGTAGEELVARLAARLNGAALGRCSHINLEQQRIHIRRAAYGARVALELSTEHARCFATLRVERSEVPMQIPTMERVTIELTAPLPIANAIRREQREGKERPLEGAKIVVSGGRGMGGEAGFAALAQLAECLGASLGGSLPTVDAGWVPVSKQVGQSGKYVNPEVYVAVGISGTPQHLAGVDRNSRIVAINKDPNADIFGVAEIGVVADWQEFVPRLTAELIKRK